MTLQKKPIILCVDDEPANLKLLENILVPRGYEVVSAATGEDALQKIKTRTIDLVLLDLMLPGMDGLQVSRKIKDNKKYQEYTDNHAYRAYRCGVLYKVSQQ